MSTDSATTTATGEPRIEFQTSPDKYHHWNLTVDGRVARLARADADVTNAAVDAAVALAHRTAAGVEALLDPARHPPAIAGA